MMKFKEYIVLDENDEILNDWDEYADDDYVKYELVDKATGKIIMSGDNTHDYINFAIDNFLSGVAYTQDTIIIDRYIRMPNGTEVFCYTENF